MLDQVYNLARPIILTVAITLASAAPVSTTSPVAKPIEVVAETQSPAPTPGEKKIANAPKPTPVATPKPAITPKQAPVQRISYPVPTNIEERIRHYASQYGADPTRMIKIAKCESGFRPEALSPSGAYAGLFQFVSSTWVSNRRAMGLNTDPSLRFNAEESIKTAAFKMGRDGYGAWPVCSRI